MLLIFLVFAFNIVHTSAECFSCMSNNNWNYYVDRIPGLKNLSIIDQPPHAPLACILDPIRVYADKIAVACKGYCYKWTSSTILPNGNIEVSVLRGCYDRMLDPEHHNSPTDNRCFQTPDDYSHRAEVEYMTECFCKGFMCNVSSQSIAFTAFTLSSIFLFF